MKLLFFDIDGTLHGQDEKIPASACETIRRLQLCGHKCFINSGRSRGFITNPQLLALSFDGIISGCSTRLEIKDEAAPVGTLRYKTVYSRQLPADQLLFTMEFLHEKKVSAIIEGEQYLYFDDYFYADGYGRRVIGKMGNNARRLTEEWGKWQAGKMSCLIEPEIIAEVRAKLGHLYSFIRHTERTYELVPLGYDKALGVRKACELFGVPLSETYAFGDSNNDMEMMQTVTHSVAMGNGTDRLKARCEYVTAPMLEDGIKKACLHYGLIDSF